MKYHDLVIDELPAHIIEVNWKHYNLMGMSKEVLHNQEYYVLIHGVCQMTIKRANENNWRISSIAGKHIFPELVQSIGDQLLVNYTILHGI